MTWKVEGVEKEEFPVDQPCIQEVTYGATDGLSPIVLRVQHLLLVKEEYQCKVVI